MSTLSDWKPKTGEPEALQALSYPEVGGAGDPHRAGGGSDNAVRSEQARREGAREGELRATAEFEAKLQAERAKVAAALREFERERREYYGRVEGEIVHLALAIAAKILHREAQVDRFLLAGLVRVALDKLQHNTQAMVRVRPEEAESWREFFSQNAPHGTPVEVEGDPLLEVGNCVLQTSLGATELGFDAQLKEIERGFFDLLAQRPEKP